MIYINYISIIDFDLKKIFECIVEINNIFNEYN